MSLALRVYREILWLRDIFPKQQQPQDKWVQTLVVVVAHDSAESDEMMKLVNVQRLGDDGEVEGRTWQQH